MEINFNKNNVFAPHPIISDVLTRVADKVLQYENEYSIINNSLKVQLCLHLFKYSLSEIYMKYHSDNVNINTTDFEINQNLIKNELEFLAKRVSQKNSDYLSLFQKTQPNEFYSEIHAKSNEAYEISDNYQDKINFGLVNSEIGNTIQDKFHYIGEIRKDTKFHFGLFRNNSVVPFTYVAFSVLDREYLHQIPCIINTPKDKILVQTRAYAFHNAPKNSMSYLFKCCSDYFKENTDFEFIITAINQNLLFGGKSFLGCSYFPVASSPLIYHYIDGIYSTRRRIVRIFGTDDFNIVSLKKNFTFAKLQSFPILWLVKGISRRNNKQIENKHFNNELGIFEINEELYAKH